MAMAFGFTTDQAMTMTDALLKNAAGIGADNSMLDRMAYNLAQVRLQGKVTALDIRQLALAGFDLVSVLKFTGEQMGVNVKDHLDFNAAIKSGKITWQDFVDSFQKYADRNFGGASERMARTLMGLKSTFHDVFVLTMPMIFGPAAESITAFLNGILNKFIGFRKSGVLETWGINVKNWVDRALWAFTHLFNKDSTRFKVANLIDIFFPKVKDPFEAADTLIAVWNVVTKIWRAGVFVVTEVMNNLKSAFAGLTTFWQQNGGQLIAIVSRIFSGIKLKSGEEGGGSWIDSLMSPLKLFIDWLVANGPKITGVLSKVADFLTGTFFPAAKKVIEFVGNNWQSILLFFAAFKIGMTIFSSVMSIVKTVSLVITVLSSPITLILGLIGLLVVAWTKNWGDIQGKAAAAWAYLQPLFQQIGQWLQVNIPVAIAWLSNVWTTVLLPAITAVWTWMTTTLFPFLATLWAWLSVNIPLALQTLANYWTGTLWPALQSVWNFIATYILPGFQALANIFSIGFRIALGVFTAAWNLIQPTIQVLMDFVNTYVMPIWNAVASLFQTVLATAISIAAYFWTSILLPAIQGVQKIINDDLMPVINDIVDIFNLIAGIVGTAFAGFWQNVLLPPLEKIYAQFNEFILPILTKVRDFIRDEIGPKIKWFLDEIISPLVTALETGLHNALQWFYDILQKIKKFLEGFELPDWLSPGSPTPLELGLRGINKELDKLGSKRMPNVDAMINGMPGLNPMRSFASATAAGGNGVTVQVRIDNISNEVDVNRAAYKIAKAIQRNRANG
jgi:tape measure domain-containing protein